MKRRDKRRWFLHKKHAQELANEGMAMHTSLVQISETAEAAAIALETLSDRERQIVVLKVYEDMSYKEIAEITELSTGNVGFVLHRAMEKLAKELTKQFARRKGGGL
jgi:RNA polymerase sigma-70 factor (ECF subfamily)